MTHIIHTGNSFVVRTPKAMIQRLGFKENTNLVFKITDDGLLISPEMRAREAWEQEFKPSKKKANKSALSGEFPNEFDKEEWKW